jgi:hypothetical protein
MVRVVGIDRRQNGAGIVHILKFYGFYAVVSVIPWLGASFAKNCGTPVRILSFVTLVKVPPHSIVGIDG